MGKDTGILLLAGIGFIVLASFILGVLGSVFWVAIKFIFPLVLAIGVAKFITVHLGHPNKKRYY